MKQIKKGKFSNYQFNREFLTHSIESTKSETSSPVSKGFLTEMRDLKGFRSKAANIDKHYAKKLGQNLMTEE